MMLKTRCPTPHCEGASPVSRERPYVKDGYFKRKADGKKIPRYKCRHCGKKFSTQTTSPFKNRKTAAFDRTIFLLVCNGVPDRQIAVELGLARKTVARRISFLAKRARYLQELFLLTKGLQRKKFGTPTYIQFDEMEGFLHTKLKPISIALAVDTQSRVLVDARVATFNARRNFVTANRLYGRQKDTRFEAREQVISSIADISGRGGEVHIYTDGFKGYDGVIRNGLPGAFVYPVTVKRTASTTSAPAADDIDEEDGLRNDRPLKIWRWKFKGKRKERDPLFLVNHMCARLRSRLHFLRRKTWNTIKTKKSAQERLDLFLAAYNRLPLFVRGSHSKFDGPKPPHPNRLRYPSPSSPEGRYLYEDEEPVEFDEWEFDRES